MHGVSLFFSTNTHISLNIISVRYSRHAVDQIAGWGTGWSWEGVRIGVPPSVSHTFSKLPLFPALRSTDLGFDRPALNQRLILLSESDFEQVIKLSILCIYWEQSHLTHSFCKCVLDLRALPWLADVKAHQRKRLEWH